MEFSNGLSKAQTERLVVLSEECSETIQAVAKILRHGFEARNPNDGQETNRKALERELADVLVSMAMLVENHEIDEESMLTTAEARISQGNPHLHYQGSYNGK